MRGKAKQPTCSCGSGKTAESCGQGAGERHQGLALRSVLRALQTKLTQFAMRQRFQAEYEEAYAFYFGDPAFDTADDITAEDEAWFLDWFVHDFRLGNGHRIVEIFALEHGAALDPKARDVLARLQEATLTVLQVCERPGHSNSLLITKDLISGTTRHLLEPDPPPPRWSILIGRPVQLGCVWDFSSQCATLPPSAGRPLLQQLRGEWRRYRRLHPDEDLRTFLHDEGYLFHDLWMRWSNERSLYRYRTEEGEPVVGCRALYDLRDGVDAARAALQTVHGLTAKSEDTWELVAEVVPGEVLPIAEVQLKATGTEGRLEIAAWSVGRLERAKAALEAALADVVSHRVDTLRWSGRRGSTSDDRKRWQAGTERFYNRWPDLPAPSLQGATPRAAAKRPLGMQRVGEQLQLMEYIEQAKALQGEAAFDVPALRRRLGINAVPAGPTLGQERPQWWRNSDAAVAECIAKLLGGEPGPYLDSALWLWHDYLWIESPRIRKPEAWAEACVRVLADIEQRPAPSAGFRGGQSVRRNQKRMREALGLAPYDERYCIEHPIDKLLTRWRTYTMQMRAAAQNGSGPKPHSIDWIVQRMLELRSQIEAEVGSMPTLRDRAWELFVQHVPGAQEEQFWAECFMDWFLFDRPIPVQAGRRPVELCADLAESRGDANADALADLCGRHPRFCRVESIYAGSEGRPAVLHLSDLVDECAFDVVWPAPVEFLRIRDVVMVRPAPIGEHLTCMGHSLHFDSDRAADIRKRLIEEKSLVERWHGAQLSWPEFYSLHAERVYGIAYRMVEEERS